MGAAQDDEYHISGNLVRGKYNDYLEGGHGHFNHVPALSEVLTRMWGRAADQDEPNESVLQAIAMKSLTSGQSARRNEQKSAKALSTHNTTPERGIP